MTMNQCNHLDKDIMSGWWGKYKRVNGKIEKIWIGPMTKKEMLKADDTYRHNFSRSKPAGK